VTRELGVDIALRWGSGYDTAVTSFVNIIATPKGGTHLAGFERALVKTANEALRATRILKVADDSVVKEDVLEGLTAVVTVRLAEPQFEGQTKEILGTAAATKIVAEVVSREFGAFLTDPKTPKADRLAASCAADKIHSAAKTRLAARAHKDAQRRKTALESSAMPAKLADCRSDDVDRTELFIVEGDSALGTAKLRATRSTRRCCRSAARSSTSRRPPSRHAQERRVRLDHPGDRRRNRPDVRPRPGPLRQDHLHGGRGRRRLAHQMPAADARAPLHAAAARGRAGVRGRPAAAPVEVVGRKEPIYTYSESQMRRTVAELERKGKRVKDPIQRYKGSARWTPTSSPRRRWTPAAGCCAD
jgi:DNA gyrase subunit B